MSTAYKLTLNDWELNMLTGIVERMMLDAEMSACLGHETGLVHKLMDLLQKMENVQGVEHDLQ